MLTLQSAHKNILKNSLSRLNQYISLLTAVAASAVHLNTKKAFVVRFDVCFTEVTADNPMFLELQ